MSYSVNNIHISAQPLGHLITLEVGQKASASTDLLLDWEVRCQLVMEDATDQ